MKRVALFLLAVLIAACGGCGGDSSQIEGKVVDGKGQPMSGVKMIAKAVEPTRGEGQHETASGSDGVFRFKGLSPLQGYSIFPSPDRWRSLDRVSVRTGEEGLVARLSTPVKIRFRISSDGIITDTQTGLEWAPAQDSRVNWDQARYYVQNLSLGGKGWRLPERSELEGIYESVKGDMGPLFHIQHNWVWTVEMEDKFAWAFNFGYGGADRLPRGRSDSRFRALAVRPAK